MNRTVRRTVVGALVGGGLFLLAAVYQSLRAGGELTQYAAPTAALVVIGATVGGLLGPLLGRIGSRRTGAERREEDGSTRGAEREEGT